MSYNSTLKYRTFDDLMEDVRVDFKKYHLQDLIEPAQLIKVVKRVNYDLGLRIMMTKEVLLEVEKGRVKLPDDFFTFNFGLICDTQTVQVVTPQGTNIQEVPVYQETPTIIDGCAVPQVNCTKCQSDPCNCSNACESVSASCVDEEYNYLVPYGDSCTKPRVFMNCKNECYELIQIVNTQTYVYSGLYPLRMRTNSQDIDCGCPNLYINSNDEGWIKDGFLFTSFTTGKVYVNYQGLLEDSDGNLLVPDHDMINEYYEYSVKQRILENLIMNDEPVSPGKIQIIEQRYRAARNYALSIVNTPNFAEMKELWRANRKAQYHKYYNMFKSYPSWVYDLNKYNSMANTVTNNY